METTKKLLSVAHTLYKIGAKTEAIEFFQLALEAPDSDSFFAQAGDATNKQDMLYDEEKKQEAERAEDLVKNRTLEQMLKNGDAPVGTGLQAVPQHNFAAPVSAALDSCITNLKTNKYTELAALLEAALKE